MQQTIEIEGYKWGRDGLWNSKRNVKVSNAIPVLINRVRYVHWMKNYIREELRIVFRYSSGSESREVIISGEELRNGKFMDKIPADVAIYIGYSKKIIEIYRLWIQEQMVNYPVEEITEYDPGWNNKTYHWGGVQHECLQQNDGPHTYGITMEFASLIGASKYISGTALAVIHGILRHLLNEAGITHNFVTYLEGETGIGKTDMAKKLGNYHPTMNIFTSLNSDKKLLKKHIQGLRDVTLIIDDHCISASTRVKERQLDIMSEVIQNASDSGRILLGGTESYEGAGEVHLLVTGERRINNFSTFNRCFLISMEEKLSDEVWKRLNDFSQAGKMYEFMKQFILWIQDNYDEVSHRMRVNYREYLLRTKKKMQYNVPGIERIRGTIAVQLTLSKCLLDYFACVKIEEKVFVRATNAMDRCIWDGGEDMCTFMLEQKNRKNMLQYLPAIANMIIAVGNGTWLTDSEDVYRKYRYINGRDGRCIGVCLNRGYWSFNPKRMSELLAEELECESVSTKSIGAELKYYSLVRVDSEGKMSCRWNSKERMYHVRIKELVELVYPELGIADEIERMINENYC